MEDYMLVIRAQNARSEMQEAKKRIKAETRRKYEAMMNADMAEAIEDVELKFARVLAEVHDAGVPQSLLRREVLRTNVWNTWTYWRDKANIEPERVTIANARAERARAEAPFVWSDDYTRLIVKRGVDGAILETPITYENFEKRLRHLTGGVTKIYWTWDIPDTALDRELSKRYIYKWHDYIKTEVERAAEAGELVRDDPGNHYNHN